MRAVNFTICFDHKLFFHNNLYEKLTIVLFNHDVHSYRIAISQLSFCSSEVVDMSFTPSSLCFKMSDEPNYIELNCIENFVDVYGLTIEVADKIGLKKTVDMLNKFLGAERITSE